MIGGWCLDEISNCFDDALRWLELRYRRCLEAGLGSLIEVWFPVDSGGRRLTSPATKLQAVKSVLSPSRCVNTWQSIVTIFVYF